MPHMDILFLPFIMCVAIAAMAYWELREKPSEETENCLKWSSVFALMLLVTYVWCFQATQFIPIEEPFASILIGILGISILPIFVFGKRIVKDGVNALRVPEIKIFCFSVWISMLLAFFIVTNARGHQAVKAKSDIYYNIGIESGYKSGYQEAEDYFNDDVIPNVSRDAYNKGYADGLKAQNQPAVSNPVSSKP